MDQLKEMPLPQLISLLWQTLRREKAAGIAGPTDTTLIDPTKPNTSHAEKLRRPDAERSH